MPGGSFSFHELKKRAGIDLAHEERLVATDGVELSYRRYIPSTPEAAILFYHGGGAHSGAGYQFIGTGLKNEYNIAVYTPDIRGHGSSGGIRGDAPSPSQIFSDITTFIRYIRSEHPNLPLFLGGHSSGAGLSLNYSGQIGREGVTGYLFLSPQLGVRAQTERASGKPPFARVDRDAFAGYFSSGGKLNGHNFAVKFNYPPELLASDAGMVESITVNMSVSLIPGDPREQFTEIDSPFGLWIGSEDELFLPEKVVAFGELALAVRADSEVMIVPGAKHLSILVNAHHSIGRWIIDLISRKIA